MLAHLPGGRSLKSISRQRVLWKPGANQGKKKTPNTSSEGKAVVCTQSLPWQPVKPAGPSVHALHRVGPCRWGFEHRLPAVWAVLRITNLHGCDTGGGHRAGGSGLERRELHRKVRTKITCVRSKGCNIKKNPRTLGFIIVGKRFCFGFFLYCCKNGNTNIRSICGGLFWRWKGHLCNDKKIKFTFFWKKV